MVSVTVKKINVTLHQIWWQQNYHGSLCKLSAAFNSYTENNYKQ